MDFKAELARLNPDPAFADWLAGQLSRGTQAQAEVERQRAELRAKDLKIQALTLELAHHKRIRFGVKSEALAPEQRDLFADALDEDGAAIAAEIAQQQGDLPAKRQAKPTGRKPLPPDLPRIEHRHEPVSCACGRCGGQMVKIGEDVSEQLDVEPARFFVHRHIRPQYACRACETVAAAPVPPAVIDGGMAAPGLLAWVMIQKYADHMPLYRIEQVSERHGAPIARSTLAEWVGRVGLALQPLSARLSCLLKQRAVLHADETPVRQLNPGSGKTRQAYLWVYRSNVLDTGPPLVVFDYRPGRSGDHARAFLDGWRGHLMVDDYNGYKALFRRGVTELGCMVHARRQFFELQAKEGHPVATEAITRIAALYAVEAKAAGAGPAARLALRQSEARPLLADLHRWLEAQRRKTANGSTLAKAIDYSLRRWPALTRYADSGDLPIDNNPAENAVRPICLGKKNWLFTGSERAGQRAAAIQTLLATAALNDFEPLAWLSDTLHKLPAWPNSRIDELLPIRTIVA